MASSTLGPKTIRGRGVGRSEEAQHLQQTGGGHLLQDSPESLLKQTWSSSLPAPHSLTQSARQRLLERSGSLNTSFSSPTLADGAGSPGRPLTTAPAPGGPFGVVSAMGDTQIPGRCDSGGKKSKTSVQGDDTPTCFQSRPGIQTPREMGSPSPVQHTVTEDTYGGRVIPVPQGPDQSRLSRKTQEEAELPRKAL